MTTTKPEYKIDWSKWEEIEIKIGTKNNGNCRYCKHSEWHHRTPYPSLSVASACRYEDSLCKAKNIDCIDILIPKKTPDLCPCLRYIPGENLAYLEWKANQIANG